jgi:tuftelin-interacting protein 11
VYLLHEETRVRQAVERQEEGVRRLKGVMAVVGRVKEIEREVAELMRAAAGGGVGVGPKELLGPFGDEFDELLGGFPEEYKEMKLDEVVVGAIAPIVSGFFFGESERG